MAIILPLGLTTAEIRVLQEYRRLNAQTLPLATIKGIKHPIGGGETPAVTLVEKGFLEADAAKENFAITAKGKDFLAIEALPGIEETSDAAVSAALNDGVDGV
ncbi:MAG: hypothetical protein JO197_05615 [Acidobacteria bacterium]|nr:hypothetical protein [Acidobacteriota bacterium]MBV9475985.1 hypothetical protein [Acidobacteriota bacterium]